MHGYDESCLTLQGLLGARVSKAQVFLTLDKPDKDRIDKQSAAMDAARSMMAASGDESAASSCMRQEQRKLIMDLYRLTAEVKVCFQTLAPFATLPFNSRL